MESEFIRWIRERLPADPRLRLGPGDDAAILRRAADGDTVLTVDLLADGVDFDLRRDDPRRVGRKALAVNLSDLAAMAARPWAAVIAVNLPRSGGRLLAEQLYEGILPLAKQFDIVIAGGDTNSWDGRLVISVTALGLTGRKGPLLRSGARPGDAILVTGQFGGSILGRHFDFEPRVREALELHERYELTAGMDVSDGLALDLARLAAESGCGAVVDLEKFPIAAAARELAAQAPERGTALDHALSDGEDFELILAMPIEVAEHMVSDQAVGTPLTMIGQFIAEPGLWRLGAGGRHEPLAPRGYEHPFS